MSRSLALAGIALIAASAMTGCRGGTMTSLADATSPVPHDRVWHGQQPGSRDGRARLWSGDGHGRSARGDDRGRLWGGEGHGRLWHGYGHGRTWHGDGRGDGRGQEHGRTWHGDGRGDGRGQEHGRSWHGDGRGRLGGGEEHGRPWHGDGRSQLPRRDITPRAPLTRHPRHDRALRPGCVRIRGGMSCASSQGYSRDWVVNDGNDPERALKLGD